MEQPLAVELPQSAANLSDSSNKKRASQSGRTARNRRASKPAMEKRRRARINECLDMLKSYVLNDSTNRLCFADESKSTSASNANAENQDEETVAQILLKSSGLINRHRGRKNPNKLEKADILELTVDYVRRLHEQRNELLEQQQAANILNLVRTQTSSFNSGGHFQVPDHLNQPLTLDLSPKSRFNCQQQQPPTPPPSSASSSPTVYADEQLRHLAPLRYANGQDVSRMIRAQVLTTTTTTTTTNTARLY